MLQRRVSGPSSSYSANLKDTIVTTGPLDSVAQPGSECASESPRLFPQSVTVALALSSPMRSRGSSLGFSADDALGTPNSTIAEDDIGEIEAEVDLEDAAGVDVSVLHGTTCKADDLSRVNVYYLFRVLSV